MKPILGTMTFSDQVDQATAGSILESFVAAGHVEVDTAYVYASGETELLLGRLQETGALDQCLVAGKVNPLVKDGLQPSAVDHQLLTSLERTRLSEFDLYYLHQPDLETPIEVTLRAVYKHYQDGKFKRLGLSNYAAWQVAEIAHICAQNGWMIPLVYQGMYNAITRDVERELFPCLCNYNISFYVYNPLAGGLLSGKHVNADQFPAEGRFSKNEQYQDRYWKPELLDVVQQYAQVCGQHDIAPAAAALRWLVHHSALATQYTNSEQQHGVIIGASKMQHFQDNLAALNAGPLPDEIVASLDQGWERGRASCIKYFRP